MNYVWEQHGAIFKQLKLRTETLSIELIKNDKCSDENIEKEKFKGTQVEYLVNDKILVHGFMGKTVWYIPALDEAAAEALKINIGEALKIIKYPVYNDVMDEYQRLIEEFTIQKILSKNNLAPEIKEIILVKNTKQNVIMWLNQDYFHAAGNMYFTEIVEHVEHDGLDLCNVDIDSDGYVHGKIIDDYILKCKNLRIEPYDLCIGNVFYNAKTNRINVVDVHKWKRSYKIEIPSHPKYMQIELNNTCNAKCKMCNIPSMKRKRGIMDDDLYRSLLIQANELGVEYITPFLHGEPLLRKDFIEKVRLINELAPKAKITIFTNASLLNDEVAEELSKIKNIEQIVFSFPGGNKDIYENVTGLSFENTIVNIKNAILKLRNFDVRISMPKCLENKESEQDFYKLWKGYKCSSYDTYNYLDNVNNSLCGECYEHCDRAIRSMTVMYDGRVCLCCMDSEGEYIFGDVSKEPIKIVWNNSLYREFRKKHIISRLYSEPCNICTQKLNVEEY